MNRHPFRWEALVFGVLFLSVAGGWTVWSGDLLTGQEMSYLVSSLLIVAGVAGVVATFWRPRRRSTTPDPTPDLEESTDEATDAQH